MTGRVCLEINTTPRLLPVAVTGRLGSGPTADFLRSVSVRLPRLASDGLWFFGGGRIVRLLLFLHPD